ncbi:MAG: phosphomannomutase/phosphoglucomutase [Acidimicrobiales bacterium]
MADLAAIFKAYDIRGTFPDQIDTAASRAIGGAFARFVRLRGSGSVVVGRDMRPSGADLVEAFTAGVLEHGVDVVDIGLCATDMMYFASGKLQMPGAVFTASHNPAGYNGVKMCLAGAAPVGSDSGLGEIRALAEAGADPTHERGTRGELDLLGDYVAHVHSFVDKSRLAPLQVVADTANGMGGLVLPAVFADLPFELDHLYPELDGTFPNHPADPIQPENLRDLKRRVTELGADIGLAFDGDADRVFLVDETARGISGSLTTAVVARAVLEREPGATVIHNLICSKAVPEVVAEAGGTAVRTRVGHSFIKQVMADTGAAFGGEHSGHYYFRENYRADSGLIAALVVLEALSIHDGPLSDLVASVDRYAASGEINTEVDDPSAAIEAVAHHFTGSPTDRLDGLTVDLGDWWFNLRPSNTEPLLRLNLEASDAADVECHVDEVLSLFAPRSL